MATWIMVEFRLDTPGSDMVHRIRNWGEGLWSKLRDQDWAYVSLSDADRATDRLGVAVMKRSDLKRAKALIEKSLDEHHLLGNARLSV